MHRSVYAFVHASICLAAFILAAHPCAADILVRHDGTVIVGEMLEETHDYVIFRFQINGIWASQRFRTGDYQRIITEPGNQADEQKSTDHNDANELLNKPQKKKDTPSVCIIPLHGQVGGVNQDGLLEGTFGVGLLEELLNKAQEENAELVILDIQSPGGVVVEMEAICNAIIERHDTMHIVAWPSEAFSAAAIIALSCKDIIVRRNSLIGAAVIIQQQRSGRISAVEAKFASPHYARMKQFMEASGHPYAVIQAMTQQDKQLWWSPQDGFSIVAPDPNDTWELVDDESSVLTMTSAESLKWGIARTQADSIRDLLVDFGIDSDMRVVKLDNDAARYNKQTDHRLKQMQEEFGKYFASLNGLVEAMNGVSGKPGSSGERARWREVSRQAIRAAAGARRISKFDHKLMMRQIEFPDTITQRIDEDISLLRQVKALTNKRTVEEFNEAVEKLNTVLDEWRALLNTLQ